MASLSSHVAAAGGEGAPLKFVPFKSAVHPSFWKELERKKLNEWRLSTEPQPIVGTYSPATLLGLAPSINVNGDSFAPAAATQSVPSVHVAGTLFLVNTLAEFKALDKQTILSQAAEDVRKSFTTGDGAPAYKFVMLVHADVKKHKYVYWFGFPAWNPRATTVTVKSARPVTPDEKDMLVHCMDTMTSASLSPLCRIREGSSGDLLFLDPSSSPQHPGWPLRAFLDWIEADCALYCVRGDVDRGSAHGSGTVPASLRLDLRVASRSEAATTPTLGWELNDRGKPGPRMADLGSTMDPAQLAMASADLNVKLMRWRMLPELDTDGLGQLKCLLLGAGTLGCEVARTLMGWGVRHISFVDNGKVSYSNPARQSLFAFEDCKGGGKHKAVAAAAALQTILPGMVTKGHVLTIPMPGHGVTSGSAMETSAREATETLRSLIADADVVFLGTDSRESRWLPTVICVAEQKMCINVALGFDSYLVMRHGVQNQAKGSRLGCYFCADIVAPGDSLTGRTLDQQCTVTRPGLAPCAAGLAVELMVALWSHPAKECASAGDTAGPFGVLPHQIRGHLTSFQNTVAHGFAYDKCTACSACVVDEYMKDPWALVLRVLAEPLYLEQITGLEDMKKELDDLMGDEGDMWGRESDGDGMGGSEDDEGFLL